MEKNKMGGALPNSPHPSEMYYEKPNKPKYRFIIF
jgi:hypothetical protein